MLFRSTRTFEQAVPETPHQSDLYVLSLLAQALGKPLGFSTVRGAAKEFGTLAHWDGARATFTPQSPANSQSGVSLATWRQLLDNGAMQVNEPNLSGTARKAVARMNARMAQSVGVGRIRRLDVWHRVADFLVRRIDPGPGDAARPGPSSVGCSSLCYPCIRMARVSQTLAASQIDH
mgnify:CR=1 FL=1